MGRSALHMEVTRIAATEMGSGLVPRVSGEEGKTDRDQQAAMDRLMPAAAQQSMPIRCP